MKKAQAETIINSMDISRNETLDIEISQPIQTLFDECLNFISVNDFNL